MSLTLTCIVTLDRVSRSYGGSRPDAVSGYAGQTKWQKMTYIQVDGKGEDGPKESKGGQKPVPLSQRQDP